MFVLPPPTRSLATGSAGAYAALGGIPLIEINNTLEHPTGPECQLVLGEGTYTLKDDLKLAQPPPHPSDIPQVVTNPLATKIEPPTAGTRLSIAILAPRKPPQPYSLFRIATGNSLRPSLPPSIEEETQSPKSEDTPASNGFGTASYYNQTQTPGFGDGNPALAPVIPAKATKKDQKAKPKSNIVKSNSTFVSRVVAHDNLQKRLNDRSSEGMFAFANIGRSFQWLDLSSDLKVEQMTKILFAKAHVLCHDINSTTRSSTHIDVIMGFSTGDIIWYEPFSQKYSRFNKNLAINSSPVTAIAWLPQKENLFVAAHADGTLIVYDKEKEDAEFVAEDHFPRASESEASSNEHPSTFRIRKSVNSRNQKSNPVAAWKLAYLQINNLSFSPDGQLLSVVSQDGTLTIFDYIRERVLDVYRSYYGALLCVTWSPDGQYVLTGGQDDLVSIWSLSESALVARCVGHQSWVTDVKFDPWRCDERTYRFGSVGEDCRLLLWDFSVGMLGRPKAHRQRGSVSSHVADRRQSASTVGRMGSISSAVAVNASAAPVKEVDDAQDIVVHEVDSKSSTANLPPVMSKKIAKAPLCWLGFEEHGILTSCKDGHIREYRRPTDHAA